MTTEQPQPLDPDALVAAADIGLTPQEYVDREGDVSAHDEMWRQRNHPETVGSYEREIKRTDRQDDVKKGDD